MHHSFLITTNVPRNTTSSGLPDGILSNQKFQFGYILLGISMQDVGIFYGRLVFLVPFGTIYGDLVHFSRFGILYQEKSGNPVHHRGWNITNHYITQL
jgi:hypothetical protein